MRGVYRKTIISLDGVMAWQRQDCAGWLLLSLARGTCWLIIYSPNNPSNFAYSLSITPFSPVVFVGYTERSIAIRPGNLCTREYSRLFVARFSLQTTHELYTLYTHNTWVVWSETSTKTKKLQKRLIASTQDPSSSVHPLRVGEALCRFKCYFI